MNAYLRCGDTHMLGRIEPRLAFILFALAIFIVAPNLFLACEQHSQAYRAGTNAEEKTNSENILPATSPAVENSQPRSDESEGPPKGQKHIVFCGFVFTSAEFFLAAFTLLLVIVTAFLVIYTANLWKSTKELVKRSERTAKTIERAYVKMSPVDPGITMNADTGRVDVKIEVKNWGNTPADIKDVVISMSRLKKDNPLPLTPQYERQSHMPPIEAVLVKNESFFASYDGFTFSKPAAGIAEVEEGRSMIYVFGYVDYIDRFNMRHRSGFARYYMLGAKPNNLMVLTQPGYNYDRERQHGEGNDWDEKSHLRKPAYRFTP